MTGDDLTLLDVVVGLIVLLMFIGLLVVVAGWCENRAERRRDDRIADRYRRTW